jgi:hypothetical protein
MASWPAISPNVTAPLRSSPRFFASTALGFGAG